MGELSTGSRVQLPYTRRTATVQRLIGEGSQGAVFEVAIDGSETSHALKWYFPALGSDAQRATIDDLIERGAPDSRFLWPTEIAEVAGEAGFGYLMALRDPRSVGLSRLLSGKVDVGFSVVCTLGMELADSFLALHSQGLCYRDISFGNVFFDPETGRPLICDNDNVGVDGESRSAVLGTRRFMAPEIVRREASPSTATDLYSLSVLLFYLLMVGHPLVGRRELEFATWDNDAESLLFGREPTFVFDPDNHANAPLPELHASVIANWQIFPENIRGLFTQAFTVGLTDPRNGRVRESVWRAALARLRDQVMRCTACSKETFWQPESHDAICWACGRRLADPIRLEIDGRPLVLERGTRIHPHHLRLDYDFASVVGEVVAHPDAPDRWGLRNRTGQSWEVELPNGELTTAEPDRAVGLLAGTRLTILGSTAKIIH